MPLSFAGFFSSWSFATFIQWFFIVFSAYIFLEVVRMIASRTDYDDGTIGGRKPRWHNRNPRQGLNND